MMTRLLRRLRRLLHLRDHRWRRELLHWELARTEATLPVLLDLPVYQVIPVRLSSIQLNALIQKKVASQVGQDNEAQLVELVDPVEMVIEA